MRRTIIWQWWQNPLGGGPEWTDAAKKRPPRRDKKFYLAKEFDDDDDDDDVAVRPVLATAAGLIPLTVYGDLAKNFNWWVAHTNFVIDKSDGDYVGVADTIKATPGVETLDVLTPYRCRVGFGLAFDDREVRRAIRDRLDAVPEARNERNPTNLKLDGDTRQKVAALEKIARERYKHWAIYVLPNGEIDFFHAEEVGPYKDRLTLYQRAQASAGGVVFTSHDRQ